MASWLWALGGWLDRRRQGMQEFVSLPLAPLARARAVERLETLHAPGDEMGIVVERQPEHSPRPALRRYAWLAYATAIIAAVLAFFFIPDQPSVVLAAAVVAGAVTGVVERSVYDRRVLRLEMQLADALDLMVAGLRAGSPLLAALEQAAQESAPPLRTLLGDLTAKLRLGASPKDVFAHLAARTRLESFQLFTLAMTVQWDVGGSLAPSLAKVGHSVRDRIELARRVRAMTMHARLSMLAVTAVVYLLAALMWANGPERMRAFLSASLGAWLTSVVAILQILGLAWAARLSRFDA